MQSTFASNDVRLRPTTTTRQNIHLAPRRMAWDFSRVPACPVDGDADLAAFLVAVSHFVVAFEDFGIPVVRSHLPHLADHPALEREARAFVAQEALHSLAHAQFNAVLSDRHGLRTEAIERTWARFRRDVDRGSAQEQLAAVAAFEHVIYAVADWYEKATPIHRRVHPEFHRLLLWHAMEETEHTAVAFDMYTHIYGHAQGAYRTRAEALLRVTRIGARALHGAWHAVFAQLAEHAPRQPSRFRSWKAFVLESVRYGGDFVGFLSPRFSPVDKSPDTALLPALRAQMAPAPVRGENGWRQLRVLSVRDVAEDVRAYELVPDDGAALPEWSAGAHVDVEIETGIVRPYSLCGDPADRTRYQIAVKREPRGRGGSLRMHEHVRQGSAIRVGVPRNGFPLSTAGSAASEVLLIAGGIGLTPLLAMARTLHAARRPFTLQVCARDRARVPFGREWEGWPFRSSVRLRLDSEADLPGGGRADRAGLVPRWDERRPRELYTCGPAAFIDAVFRQAREALWPASALHAERFTHPAGAQPGDRAFTLRLERSAATLVVEPHQTIVDAMEARGFAARTSCREGLCGTCVCRVVAGEVEHRDAVLSEDERRSAGRIAICVSRARGDSLALDL